MIERGRGFKIYLCTVKNKYIVNPCSVKFKERKGTDRRGGLRLRLGMVGSEWHAPTGRIKRKYMLLFAVFSSKRKLLSLKLHENKIHP